MRRIPLAIIALALAGCSRTDTASERARLEAEFERTLNGATLVGKFTSKNRDTLSEDRYTISSVKKLAGDLWSIQTRIQYGERDVTVPVPVKILWAGDTPVITLTDLTIPGVGTFTSRVLIYRDEYAGTWSSSKGHGGQMFGRIERSR